MKFIKWFISCFKKENRQIDWNSPSKRETDDEIILLNPSDEEVQYAVAMEAWNTGKPVIANRDRNGDVRIKK